MNRQTDRSHRRWLYAACSCLFLALLMTVLLVIWGVDHDLRLVRATLIDSEMNRLRTHATRTTAHIQDNLRKDLVEGPIDLGRVHNYEWLKLNWARFVKQDESRLYASIVDPTGLIIMHIDTAREGQHLEKTWYDSSVAEGGEDVVDTHSQALAGGLHALDVRVPIIMDDKTVGYYHSGLAYSWLENEIAELRDNILKTWIWISVGMFILIAFSGMCLYQISRRIVSLREAVEISRVRRFAELGQLVAGLAHEIRNPLNAIMLNNHVVSRFLSKLSRDGEYRDVADEQSLILKETTQEIERVEGMLRMLLGYARPVQPHPETLDVGQEIRSLLTFLKSTFDQADVLVRARVSEQVVWIHFDRDRLRQILLNLFTNAREAAGRGGMIEVDVKPGVDLVEITVGDNGPGVREAEREKIFEPFYSTKDKGTGLGLALVRLYLEEVGGTAVCTNNEPSGARFVVRIPTSPKPKLSVSFAHSASV